MKEEKIRKIITRHLRKTRWFSRAQDLQVLEPWMDLTVLWQRWHPVFCPPCLPFRWCDEINAAVGFSGKFSIQNGDQTSKNIENSRNGIISKFTGLFGFWMNVEMNVAGWILKLLGPDSAQTSWFRRFLFERIQINSWHSSSGRFQTMGPNVSWNPRSSSSSQSCIWWSQEYQAGQVP